MKNRFLLYFMALLMTGLFAVSIQSQEKFAAAMNSMQVVPANDSAARGSCDITYKLIYGTGIMTLTCEYSGLSGDLTNVQMHVASAGQPGGKAVYDFGISGGDSGKFTANAWFPFDSWLRARRFYIDLHTANFPSGEIRGQLKPVTFDSDVDGDGRTDAFVFRPSDVCSYVLCSVNGGVMMHQFEAEAANQDVFLADFDGDGLADLATINRDQVMAGQIVTIYVQSSNNVVKKVLWGNDLYGDIPIYGNYDGDNKMDVAAFRPSEGVWYILQSSDNQPRYEYWGKAGDQPVMGDFDRDGKTDLCVVRAENDQLVWYVRRSSDNAWTRTLWGVPGDKIFTDDPVDVDGDGANDIIVMRNEYNSFNAKNQRVFYALRSSDNSWFVLKWGLPGDGYRLGDFDGDGKTDFAALRTVGKQLVWYINRSSDGQTGIIYWGLPDDK